MWLATQYVCSVHVLLWWHYQLGTRVLWLHCVSGACYEGEETRREGCLAPLFTQYQIENNVECLWTIVWYFYLNVLLFVWVGNETFAHWRQLPGSLWAGVCDYDQFWSLAGRVAQSAEAMPNFSFCYVTLRKNQLYIYTYIIIKLYNNTTIFSRLLPICVCFRGSAPAPAGGLTAPPDPQLGKIVHPEKSVTYFFFPNDMPAL